MNENQNVDTKRPGLIEAIGSIFKKGWEANDYPTRTRTDIYVEQIKNADDKLEDKSLSKKERKFYKKQKERALLGLDMVDYENKNFINKALFSIAIASVAVYKTAELIKNS